MSDPSSDRDALLEEIDAWKKQAEFYRRVLDQLPCQVAVFDAELRYLYVNTASVADPEVREWLIGRTDEEYCEFRGSDPQMAKTRDVQRRRALAEGMTVGFEEELVDGAGETRHFFRNHTPVKDTGEARLIGYGFEVTDRRSREQDLRQGQKLEAIGKLAGSVAHDFNNLLTAILGYGQMLRRKVEAEPLLDRYVSAILESGERAGALIQHLLSFSRRQHLEVDEVEVDALLEDFTDVLRSTLGESVELDYDLHATGREVRLDPGRLRESLLHLAANARDAMPRGGSLKISTSIVGELELEPWHEPGQGPWLKLEVRDTGCGMDAVTQAQVFEPFFTTKDGGAGTGLGLSAVYGFVKQSGGHIRMRSTPGVGTAFEMYLGAMAPAKQEASAGAAGDRLPTAGDETILLAEDEESVRELSSDVLSGLGYRVLTASHGEEALRILDDHDWAIDLLVTDVMMPKMDGPELARRLLEKRPDIGVLYISGYTGGSGSKVELDPEIPFLPKPFHPDTLGQRVREVLDAGSPRR